MWFLDRSMDKSKQNEREIYNEKHDEKENVTEWKTHSIRVAKNRR